ncbi:MAG: hypothetical protein GX620_12770 [Chloroflexi bacterium]|nr:hypothetical protein [Chloroflexota bacterium]
MPQTEWTYKPNLERTLERRCAFYRREMNDQVLAVFSIAGMPRTHHLRCVPDYRRMCQVQIEFLQARRRLDDDWVPLAQTHFGMGVFGGIFGSEVIWRPDDETSWSREPFSVWPERLAERLRFDAADPLVDLVRRSIRYHRKQAGGQFGIGVLETIDALNLVTVLRGPTQGFQDLYLFPDLVREVMELGVQWNIDWLEMQLAEAGSFADGWCSLVDWFPWPTVWLSVDAYGSCHSDVYVKLGRDYMQRLIDHFGCGWQHLHSDGVRLLPEIVRLRNLVGLQIGEDVGYPRPFDIVRDLQLVTGEIPLQIGCTWHEFTSGIEQGTLAGGVEYHVSGAPTLAAASRMAAAAREYRDDARARKEIVEVVTCAQKGVE